ncbi:hypothetical protein QBC35DRAFT_377264 [Podospora australis]|uniref:Uncharacterized protein n=1 Tax=Podospora australis TaxID=1536484 RepID=A0AAN6WYS5_9PEZI|nr:hypothetical protein QBC35DRAFT_377264 [Podospora australis]
MWSSHNNLVSRDSEPNSNLAPGAIAGIACGAGALFLGAAGLFILYWRRQRQFDREDNFYRSSTEENPHASAMAPAVSYTMDYKMSPQQHHREDAGSSYTYSPEKPTYGFSPLGTTETVGAAMPTHPAYIPRALVRGDLPPSSTHTRSASLASGGTQKQSPPLANRRQDNTFSFSGSKPRQYLPPRLNLSGTGSKPLQGKQNTTISGPLAFPEHYQPPPHRTFRDRSLSGGRGGYNHQDQRTKTTAVGGRNRSNSATPKQQQQGGFAGNRHYAEIEVGRDSDIW